MDAIGNEDGNVTLTRGDAEVAVLHNPITYGRFKQAAAMLKLVLQGERDISVGALVS